MTYSLVVPVYGNQDSLPELLTDLGSLNARLEDRLEVVFVVDGSPDRSFAYLREALANVGFDSQLIELSRNFGSFAAIQLGLEVARGKYVANRAADLQEPTELFVEIFATLERGEADVVIARRRSRSDDVTTVLLSRLFWGVYRLVVQREMPPGGIDVFGCTDQVRCRLVALNERHSSLVGLLMWLGFRRRVVDYDRLPRRHGRSAWSLRRKLAYMSDSLFSFSDLPIRLLAWGGALGIAFAMALGTFIIVARFAGEIDVPGYTALAVLVLLFGGLNMLGLGIVGSYVWRIFENTKSRPQTVVMSHQVFANRPRTSAT